MAGITTVDLSDAKSHEDRMNRLWLHVMETQGKTLQPDPRYTLTGAGLGALAGSGLGAIAGGPVGAVMGGVGGGLIGLAGGQMASGALGKTRTLEDQWLEKATPEQVKMWKARKKKTQRSKDVASKPSESDKQKKAAAVLAAGILKRASSSQARAAGRLVNSAADTAASVARPLNAALNARVRGTPRGGLSTPGAVGEIVGRGLGTNAAYHAGRLRGKDTAAPEKPEAKRAPAKPAPSAKKAAVDLLKRAQNQRKVATIAAVMLLKQASPGIGSLLGQAWRGAKGPLGEAAGQLLGHAKSTPGLAGRVLTHPVTKSLAIGGTGFAGGTLLGMNSGFSGDPGEAARLRQIEQGLRLQALEAGNRADTSDLAFADVAQSNAALRQVLADQRAKFEQAQAEAAKYKQLAESNSPGVWQDYATQLAGQSAQNAALARTGFGGLAGAGIGGLAGYLLGDERTKARNMLLGALGGGAAGAAGGYYYR
jgi:hypothetical protein